MGEGETEGASSSPTEAEEELSGKDPPSEEVGLPGGRTGSRCQTAEMQMSMRRPAKQSPAESCGRRMRRA